MRLNHQKRALGYQVLKGSWDLVTRVITKATVLILITRIKVLTSLLTKSHDPPSSGESPRLVPQIRVRLWGLYVV